MYDTIYEVYIEDEAGRRFYWMDSRLWRVLEEMGKYIKKNFAVAELDIGNQDVDGFDVGVDVLDEETGAWNVELTFKVVKTRI